MSGNGQNRGFCVFQVGASGCSRYLAQFLFALLLSPIKCVCVISKRVQLRPCTPLAFFKSNTFLLDQVTAGTCVETITKRICSTCRKHFFSVLSLFMTYHRVCNQINTTDATSGAGTAHPSGAPEFAPVFIAVRVIRFLALCVCFVDRFVLLYFFFWPLCCLFFDIWILLPLWYLRTLLSVSGLQSVFQITPFLLLHSVNVFCLYKHPYPNLYSNIFSL